MCRSIDLMWIRFHLKRNVVILVVVCNVFNFSSFHVTLHTTHSNMCVCVCALVLSSLMIEAKTTDAMKYLTLIEREDEKKNIARLKK